MKWDLFGQLRRFQKARESVRQAKDALRDCAVPPLKRMIERRRKGNPAPILENGNTTLAKMIAENVLALSRAMPETDDFLAAAQHEVSRILGDDIAPIPNTDKKQHPEENPEVIREFKERMSGRSREALQVWNLRKYGLKLGQIEKALGIRNGTASGLFEMAEAEFRRAKAKFDSQQNDPDSNRDHDEPDGSPKTEPESQ